MNKVFIFSLGLLLVSGATAQEVCGGDNNVTLVEGETVSVFSPGHPGQYPNDADCLYRVHATDLSRLVMSCPQVDLQSTIFGCVDTLAFSDAENFNQLPSYCGNKKPPAELAFGDTVFIHFVSDGSGVDNGFQCDIRAEKQEVDADCECGAANFIAEEVDDKIGEKVYQGTAVGKHEYPWLGLIMTLESVPRVLCGATIINSHYVLTSARCVLGVHPEDIRLRFGEHDLQNNNESPPHKIHELEKVIVHPDFNSSNLQNDLALIRTAEQMLFATNVRPACLPMGGVDLTNTQLIAAGWGATSVSSGQSSLPRQAKLQVDPADINACASVLPPQLPLMEGQVCTSSLSGADVCTGDFGGPLVQEMDGVYYLTAISSYNTECADPSVPTVHSRVDYHSAWIQGASIDAIQCGTPMKMKKRGKLL